MPVLSREDIVAKINDGGEIIVKPFDEKHLTTCAYEVTLGRDFYFTQSPVDVFVNVTDKDSIANAWQINMVDETGETGIIIPPGDSIMGHTHEFVGSAPGTPFTTFFRSRSSMVRSGLTINGSAGWGDVGFYGRWTLLIHNATKNPVVVPFGTRVGQIAFLQLSSNDANADYVKEGGSYGIISDEVTFESLHSKFGPGNIIPNYK